MKPFGQVDVRTLLHVITLAGMIAGPIYVYGALGQKVDDLSARQDKAERRQDKSESHEASIDLSLQELKDDEKEVKETLLNMVDMLKRK